MKIEDINHITVLKTIKRFNINVEPFKDYKELSVYIRENYRRFYQKEKAEYFRTYMRERYRKKKGIVISTI
jgi:hypothetical protein